MKTWIKSVITAWLCAGVTTIVFAQDAAKYLSASQEFQRLVSQTTQDRVMPRITNKNVAELISTLSDSQHFLDLITYHLKDLDLLMDICNKANTAVMSYTLFDLKNNIDPKGDPKLVALQVMKVMEKNVQTFQDELEQLQPFQIRCIAKQIPLLSEFMLSLKPEEITDIRREGLQKARDGIFGVYSGILQIVNNPALKESYRARVLQCLAENAKTYASVLQPTARRQIFDFAKSIQTNTPKRLRSDLVKIADAMNDTHCNGLCKF